jgi:hypothetical protein
VTIDFAPNLLICIFLVLFSNGPERRTRILAVLASR